jgi:hypothetical protein
MYTEVPTIVVSDDATPLEFLRAVYVNEKVPLGTRVKCAVEAAKYVHPSLAAIATIRSDGYAEQLERAIEASRGVQQPRLIDAKRGPTNGRSPAEISAEHMTKGFSRLRGMDRRF